MIKTLMAALVTMLIAGSAAAECQCDTQSISNGSQGGRDPGRAGHDYIEQRKAQNRDDYGSGEKPETARAAVGRDQAEHNKGGLAARQ